MSTPHATWAFAMVALLWLSPSVEAGTVSLEDVSLSIDGVTRSDDFEDDLPTTLLQTLQGPNPVEAGGRLTFVDQPGTQIVFVPAVAGGEVTFSATFRADAPLGQSFFGLGLVGLSDPEILLFSLNDIGAFPSLIVSTVGLAAEIFGAAPLLDPFETLFLELSLLATDDPSLFQTRARFSIDGGALQDVPLFLADGIVPAFDRVAVVINVPEVPAAILVALGLLLGRMRRAA